MTDKGRANHGEPVFSFPAQPGAIEQRDYRAVADFGRAEMIYILAYIVLGISTGVIIRVNGDANIWVSIACVFTWPLYWFAFVFAHFVGWMPAKCAWCGKSIAGHAHKDKWAAHYLDDCDKHPLAIKLNRIQNYLDETDARNTANRVRAERAEAQLNGAQE